MKLYEAKQILKKAGYLVRSLNEDTDTDEDEFIELKTKMQDNLKAKDLNHLKNLYDKHDSLEDKINNAKFQNVILKHRDEIIDKLLELGVGKTFIKEYLDPFFYKGETVDEFIEKLHNMWLGY